MEANIRVNAKAPKWDNIQALLSRGDRKVAKMLMFTNKTGKDWTKAYKEWPESSDFYIHRDRSTDELLPWDFINHGIDRSFLKIEYTKAKQGITSSPCSMESSCSVCGVCNNNSV